jgi:hypothetical protein
MPLAGVGRFIVGQVFNLRADFQSAPVLGTTPFVTMVFVSPSVLAIVDLGAHF